MFALCKIPKERKPEEKVGRKSRKKKPKDGNHYIRRLKKGGPIDETGSARPKEGNLKKGAGIGRLKKGEVKRCA
jgi:SET domain-containing protein